MADSQVLFVYGSLMREMPNHEVLGDGARFLSPAFTKPGYALMDLGPYPGAVQGGDGALEGEVFAVSRAKLAQLDAFEGVPNFYRRVRVELEHPEGSAWIYLLASLPAGGVYIPSGSWRQVWLQRSR